MIIILSLLALASGSPQGDTLPETGVTNDMGGLFGIGPSIIAAGISGMPPGLMAGLMSSGSESPKLSAAFSRGKTQGSGRYAAKYAMDPGLPNHTVYAPASPPKGIKMPVMVFGNGGCINNGAMFANFLTEIASYGYVVIANGKTSGLGQSKVSQMKESIDWVMRDGASKYGTIDKDKIVAAGQSCGGLEAYSTSYREPRVKLTMIFNVGVFDESRRHYIKELRTPIAWFVGGPKDAGFIYGEKDYNLLNPSVPALFASLDTGHMGTYMQPGGGKFGKAAVAFLEWQLRGNLTAKAIVMDPKSPGSLVQDHWNVTSRNMA